MELQGIIRAALGVAALAAAASAHAAFEPFVVRDLRVEGAQRVQERTVYSYVPMIRIGETVDERLLQEAGRALFSTKFFRDFEFRRDGDTLVIAVLERPSILEFTFDGNKDIEDEDLQRVLDDAGLSRGNFFNPSVLEEIQQALTEQYYGRGKYGAVIDTSVTETSSNQVIIAINIKEGDRAKIRQINIVGNETFGDDELLGAFELRTGNLLSFFRKNDRYSKEALEGDLETLRSYYMDRGFADFRFQDVRVQISPDNRDIFISIAIHEGDRYTISGVDVAMTKRVVPEQELLRLIRTGPGAIFSQAVLTMSEENMAAMLGDIGYAFADIEAVTDLDEEAKTVDVKFIVDPSNRVYVQRINFEGADNVNDEVFRREMRQLEGAYLSNRNVERSKVLLQRLPYIEQVEQTTDPVPNTRDLVDVNFEITEGLPGQLGGTLGYSEAYGLTIGGNFIHSNFMGTGNRVALELSAGEYQKVYQIEYTDAYRTIDGLTRSLSMSYQDLTQFTSVSSDFSTTTLTAGINWEYPFTDLWRVRYGFAYQDAELLTSLFSSSQARDWVLQNGDPFAFGGIIGTKMKSLEFATALIYDSRNATLFPTAGTRLATRLNASIPGSNVEYYVLGVDFTKYFDLPGRWMFRINNETAYGIGYGDTMQQPPFHNRYAGGPGSVRGFQESTLGPLDSLGNPYGGNLLFTNQFELILPTPPKVSSSVRMALFFDMGNVFSTDGTRFTDRLGAPADYDFDYDRLKKSVGFGIEWLAPLGLLRLSYAVPLNEDEATDRFFGDHVEEFQFSIGNAF